MIKENKVLKEAIERQKFCDGCGTEIRIGLQCSKAQCEYCKKDLCEKCIGHEEDTGGDYRIVYCKKCWEIGQEFLPRIELLEAQKKELYAEWRKRASA